MVKANGRLNLSVQYACAPAGVPTRTQVKAWVRTALTGGGQITVRFVDSDEGQGLNRDYRGKDYATNVLSFPYEQGKSTVGDLVVCTAVVEREAEAQGKVLEAHYAHLIVHGMLHLQGYDHETNEDDARAMEALEREILAGMGYPDPYAGEA